MSGKRNRLSVIGVRRYTYTSDQWVAEWVVDGKLHTKAFSVNKYGDRNAKDLAVAARLAGQAAARRFKNQRKRRSVPKG